MNISAQKVSLLHPRWFYFSFPVYVLCRSCHCLVSVFSFRLQHQTLPLSMISSNRRDWDSGSSTVFPFYLFFQQSIGNGYIPAQWFRITLFSFQKMYRIIGLEDTVRPVIFSVGKVSPAVTIPPSHELVSFSLTDQFLLQMVVGGYNVVPNGCV